jgi:hypothetical protein
MAPACHGRASSMSSDYGVDCQHVKRLTVFFHSPVGMRGAMFVCCCDMVFDYHKS